MIEKLIDHLSYYFLIPANLIGRFIWIQGNREILLSGCRVLGNVCVEPS